VGIKRSILNNPLKKLSIWKKTKKKPAAADVIAAAETGKNAPAARNALVAATNKLNKKPSRNRWFFIVATGKTSLKPFYNFVLILNYFVNSPQ
jgi:hypothetical protein